MTEVNNRLIIVGNGFDLAHKFPTSYNDFITHLLFHKFKEAFNSQSGLYEDDYFIILKLNNCHFEPLINISVSEYLKFKCENLYIPLKENLEQIKKSIGEIENNDGVYFHVKDEFINMLFKTLHEFNWVDIEMAYYTKLKELALDDKIIRQSNKYSIKRLNDSFEMLRNELINYLQQINTNYTYENMAKIFDFRKQFNFKGRFRPDDFENRPNETLILNFNYTNTVHNYKYKKSWGDDIKILQIHGDLENESNPIIFGYGDEIEESYKKLELKNDNELLRHMKNKDYALTSNYSKLISFIEQEPFEVYILGHSCGLSDRVMLNTIFEHKYCDSINVFYYLREDGTDDFIDIFQNISRQFSLSKRADLRIKIKAKSESINLPQKDKETPLFKKYL